MQQILTSKTLKKAQDHASTDITVSIHHVKHLTANTLKTGQTKHTCNDYDSWVLMLHGLHTKNCCGKWNWYQVHVFICFPSDSRIGKWMLTTFSRYHILRILGRGHVSCPFHDLEILALDFLCAAFPTNPYYFGCWQPATNNHLESIPIKNGRHDPAAKIPPPFIHGLKNPGTDHRSIDFLLIVLGCCQR